MPSRVTQALGFLGAVATLGVLVIPIEGGEPTPLVSPLPPPGDVREADIRFYQARVTTDPIGALDRMRLGALLLDRARASGEARDLIRAEELARESIALRQAHNAAAWHLLAAALLGQHRFLEALEVAERLVAMNPEATGARALRGEILLELGRYPAADSVFAGLGLQRYQPNVAPRYARWLELRGRSGGARRLLERARVDAVRNGLPDDQIAWYHLRLGELALRHGRHRQARGWLESGLAIRPADWRLLAVRARLALAEGDGQLAIALGDSSLSLHFDPATLALMGDAWAREGEPSRAEAFFRGLETAAGSAPRGGYHRAWYLALLDHQRQVPLVLAQVTRDLETRQDIYGWDLLAWALHQSGRRAEARAAMSLALQWGTDDPDLRRHTRAIEASP
ncbi:MAG TPA: tetratricopeptide repeat protein [Gemmatimonadales bacterium]